MGYINLSSIVAILAVFTISVVLADDVTPIPADKAQVEAWFKEHVKPFAARKGTFDPIVDKAESFPKIIKVDKAGGADFKTLTEAVKSVPVGNTQRVIIKLAPGVYREKVTVDRGQSFVTIMGKPGAETNLTYDGTAAKYGTVDSATLIIWAEYFMAANLNLINTSPMPAPGSQGQALAMRINGDKGAFYNCRFYGFQDTLCDDRGNHFFKNCHIQGTYDFVFGKGASLYLNTQLHAVGTGLRVIAAHSRTSEKEQSGFSFVHCKITGTGAGIYLGRSWMSHPKVVYAYTEMTSVVHPTGWQENKNRAHDKTVFYGEYMCTGPGAQKTKRVAHTQEIDKNEAKAFLTLGYIKGSKWLLPPPRY